MRHTVKRLVFPETNKNPALGDSNFLLNAARIFRQSDVDLFVTQKLLFLFLSLLVLGVAEKIKMPTARRRKLYIHRTPGRLEFDLGRASQRL